MRKKLLSEIIYSIRASYLIIGAFIMAAILASAAKADGLYGLVGAGYGRAVL